jgi:hypothetical protein
VYPAAAEPNQSSDPKTGKRRDDLGGDMERGSTKHGPGSDDRIKQRTEPLERGTPGGGRVEEDRVEESWAEGEQPLGDHVAADDADRRADIARYLRRDIFPAERDLLVDGARVMNAPRAVVASLELLPQGRAFENVEQIWEALGGERERRG